MRSCRAYIWAVLLLLAVAAGFALVRHPRAVARATQFVRSAVFPPPAPPRPYSAAGHDFGAAVLTSRVTRIEVVKSARRLRAFAGEAVAREYRVALGFQPAGPKQRQGDGRTPEGAYYVCAKNPQSQFYLSLGVSYPNPADARSGLTNGTITRAQCAAIERAHRERATPPWNTPLGGEIFIHGRGSGADWTLGCIALDDPDMKELYDHVEKGIEVRILP